MRDIEFRGKRKDNGEWVYGGYTKDAVCDYIWGAVDGIRDCKAVHPDTVGQYIGRKDKNGKIFEGDIVKREVFDGTVIGVVKFKPYRGWYLDCRHKEQSVVKTYYNNGDFVDERVVVKFAQLTCSRERNTVIGSIHDNPELLEQQG